MNRLANRPRYRAATEPVPEPVDLLAYDRLTGRTDGRTDGLTKMNSPSDINSRNATPAGGHNESTSSQPVSPDLSVPAPQPNPSAEDGWVRFYFDDADPVAECVCGWHTHGDSASDAFGAWWKHRREHDEACDHDPGSVAQSAAHRETDEIRLQRTSKVAEGEGSSPSRSTERPVVSSGVRDGLDLDAKRCSKCGEVKPRSDYFRERRSRDGLRSCCKTCHQAGVKESHARHADAYHERNVRQSRGRTREDRNRHKATWREKYRERNVERQRAFRRDNPEKASAWIAVASAIRNGSLKRADACQRCGAKDSWLEASHDDYARPLDVEWLCACCHRAKDGNPIADRKVV